MVNNKKEEVQNGTSRRLKLVQHYIQLTIAKNENICKSATFWSMIVCLFIVTILHKSCEILFLYVFHKSTF